MKKRNYSAIDKFIHQVDQGLRAIAGAMPAATRENPAKDTQESQLSETERQHVIGLIRVDHTGEVCAQALYQGQSITAKSKDLQQQLKQAALEENDHLHWCQQRLNELGGGVSYLNPLWHFGALTMGMTAGLLGDAWNLGFLAETEKQVAKHLDDHLQQLPKQDKKSHKILTQMRVDELQHAGTAIKHGGKALPGSVKWAMKAFSKLMTTMAYRI